MSGVTSKVETVRNTLRVSVTAERAAVAVAGSGVHSLAMKRKSAVLHLTLFVLGVLHLSSVRAEEPGYAWSSFKTEDGIKLSISPARRHGYDAVKGTAVVAATAARLIDVLRTFDRYPSWCCRTTDVRVMSGPGHVPPISFDSDGAVTQVPNIDPWVLFFRQRTPPLEDRWTLLSCDFRAGPRGSLVVEFHSLDRAYAGPNDAVRMDLRGYWQLRPLDRARTEVTFVVDADPNTIAPAMFVDPELHAVVRETLQKLREHVKSTGAAATP